MYALHSNPHLLSLTLVIISGVTALVLLERTLTPALRKWGDLYPALLTFLIILLKTVIPLVLLGSILKLSLESLQGTEVKLLERTDDAGIATEELSKNRGLQVENRIFDLTPAQYIEALITDKGIMSPAAIVTFLDNPFFEGRTHGA